MLNRIFLVGNLTADPSEIRNAGQSTVCDFRLACNERYGQGQERTLFIDVECWGRTAENVERYLAKGRRVLIEGRLQQDQWTDNEGQRRSKMKVVAVAVQFLGGDGGSEADQQPRDEDQDKRQRQRGGSTGGRSQGRRTQPVDAKPSDDGVPF